MDTTTVSKMTGSMRMTRRDGVFSLACMSILPETGWRVGDSAQETVGITTHDESMRVEETFHSSYDKSNVQVLAFMHL